ncbi:peptide MFS transporter [Limibacter armeniacum]|uniref:peptide MFS transporter n=1 Tax=Limibacter armeniacum TaxID=466084 RepID=UPI002FE5723E
METKGTFSHPKGLYILFFTEMWERFSYYGMRALLVLFVVANVADGGLGWEKADALALYGNYTMMVYLMSIPGGILADKLLGQKKAVMLGGLLLVAGHGIMAIPQEWAFFTALALIVLGVGCLKPNISTMVGGLYKEGDPNRDKGFTIFYIGINLGAALSSLIVPVVAAEYGWHYGFGLAGIGMLLGQVVYMLGQKHLVGIGDYINSSTSVDKEVANRPLTKIEQDRVVVLLLSFLIVIVFWGAFEQAGGLMNLYAQSKTDRYLPMFDYTIPAGVFQSVNAIFIILFGSAVAGFWAWRLKAGKETSTLLKMAIGTMIMGAGFLFMTAAAAEVQVDASGNIIGSSMIWLVLAYLFHTIGELCVSPTALSFITKLAPVKYASIMMGVYFAATGLGNKLAGVIGEHAVSGAGEEQVFTGIAIFAIAFGLILLFFFKKLKALTHGAEDKERDALKAPKAAEAV